MIANAKLTNSIENMIGIPHSFAVGRPAYATFQAIQPSHIPYHIYRSLAATFLISFIPMSPAILTKSLKTYWIEATPFTPSHVVGVMGPWALGTGHPVGFAVRYW